MNPGMLSNTGSEYVLNSITSDRDSSSVGSFIPHDHLHPRTNYTAGDLVLQPSNVRDDKGGDFPNVPVVHGPYSDSLSLRTEELGFAKSLSNNDVDKQEVRDMLDKLDNLLVRHSVTSTTPDDVTQRPSGSLRQ